MALVQGLVHPRIPATDPSGRATGRLSPPHVGELCFASLPESSETPPSSGLRGAQSGELPDGEFFTDLCAGRTKAVIPLTPADLFGVVLNLCFQSRAFQGEMHTW